MSKSEKHNPGIALRRGITLAMVAFGAGCAAPPPHPGLRLANGGRPLGNPQGVCVQIGLLNSPAKDSSCYELAAAPADEHVEPLPLDEFGYLFPALKPEPELAPVQIPPPPPAVATLAQPVPPIAASTSLAPTPASAWTVASPAVPPSPVAAVTPTVTQYVTKTVHFTTALPFKLNSAHLARANAAALAAFINSLAQYRGVVSLRITGHTDRSGPARFNHWLSLMRAKSVELRLLSLGADPRSIQIRGVGSTEPRVHAHTAADNRYVDIEVVVRVPAS